MQRNDVMEQKAEENATKRTECKRGEVVDDAKSRD